MGRLVLTLQTRIHPVKRPTSMRSKSNLLLRWCFKHALRELGSSRHSAGWKDASPRITRTRCSAVKGDELTLWVQKQAWSTATVILFLLCFLKVGGHVFCTP